MESDLGVKGTGNHYTTYFRQYDPRSGRWWSVDPVIHPWQSSYTAMDNNPVRFTDPFGDDCVGCPDPNTVPVGTEQTDELGNLYINWEREDNTGHYWEVRTETAEVLGKRPELTPIWDMGSGEAQDPPPTQLGQAQQTIAANWSNLRGLREQQALALRNSINPAADVTRVVLPIPGEEASKFMGASVSGDNVPRMSAPPPGWSLQRPFEKETTAAEWFESTDIPLMAVVRGITEIPARSLEVTANYACILATGKRCDGSDPTPEDLESGYYSLMPGGGKGAAAAKGATNAIPRTKSVLGHIFRNADGDVNPSTVASQNRYIKLFESVANNPKNLNPSILDAQAAKNGVQAYTQTFRNGKQIWVHTRNGRIFDAGVNIIPR